MKTVLDNIKKSEVKDQPFPYLYYQNAIEDDLCKRLIKEFPLMKVIAQGEFLEDNKRFSLPASKVLISKGVSPLWKDFIKAHTTTEFWHQLVDLFEDQILSIYPNFNIDFKPLKALRIGVRNVNTFEEVDILLDAQICINTPVLEKPSSVKITHIDNANKLFAGLLYLRSPNDDSEGGDLEIYKYKDDKFKFHGPRLIKDKYVEMVETVPYKQNSLILFINSLKSLHGVTNRQVTDQPRYFLNLVGEVNKNLFDLEKHNSSFRLLHQFFGFKK